MRILAVDTCFAACSAAILSDDVVLAHRHVAMERGHAEALAPMVEAVMQDAHLAFPGIDRLGVTVGPGTFTGQRVGLAFMRGMRVGLKRPLTGVTSLATMAAQAMDETGLASAAGVHDARRDEVYVEIVERTASRAPPAIMKFEDGAAMIGAVAADAPMAIAGTAAKRVEEWCRARGIDVRVSRCLRLMRSGSRVFAQGKRRSHAAKAALSARARRQTAGGAMIATKIVAPSGADCDALSRLHAAVFAESWSGQSIRGLLDTPGTFAVTARRPARFSHGAGRRRRSRDPHARGAGTPRRQGDGAALVEAAARHASDKDARAMFLEVGTDNGGARALYAKLGFLEVGRRQGYYRDASGGKPKDGLVLRARLPLGKPAELD